VHPSGRLSAEDYDSKWSGKQSDISRLLPIGFWEAVTCLISSNYLISMLGAQGLEP
jgi:hypothetical protein